MKFWLMVLALLVLSGTGIGKSAAARWSKTAHAGVPRVKRHLKATRANATPATDSRNLKCYTLKH